MQALATESKRHSKSVAVTSLLPGGVAWAVGASESPVPIESARAAEAAAAPTARRRGRW